ncbi:hypothetical protein [Sandarakinorhabdus sp.]|uniref:hypothetical protein n=1 Tax=Sandarakinorhabdus sp. TaxID=1916663 RepID=UPI00286E7A30|nr:hypothetical protein [Sandarakinorhabdus sp.]
MRLSIFFLSTVATIFSYGTNEDDNYANGLIAKACTVPGIRDAAKGALAGRQGGTGVGSRWRVGCRADRLRAAAVVAPRLEI